MNIFILDRLFFILISILPIGILAGSFITNSIIIITNIIFLLVIFKEKKLKKIFLDYYACLFFIFFFYLIFNLFFSIDVSNSILMTFGFIRYFILVLAIKYFFEEKISFKDQKKIFSFWLIILCIITIDIYIEYFTGSNIIGNSSYIPGRISSFLGEELKIGNFYAVFALISIGTIQFLIPGKKCLLIIFLLSFIFLFSSLVIGERSNFIKCMFSIILFLILYQRKLNIFKSIFFTILIVLTIFLFLNLNLKYKSRFFESFIDPIKNLSIENLIKQSTYGAHYNVAYNIFKNYPITGVGLKNFRIESGKSKYENKDFTFYKSRQSTHPHQIHLEILSELGLTGYFVILIFFTLSFNKSIKNYLTNKHNINLSCMIAVFFMLIPILPSGSFFTTYSATIFWLSYAFMITKFKAFHN